MADDSLACAKTRLKAERTCVVCKQLKPADEFYLYKYITNQGKQSTRSETRCKACNKVRREKQPDHVHEKQRAGHRAYYWANREQLNARLQEYRKANKSKVRRQRVLSEQERRARDFNSPCIDDRKLIETVFEMARIGDKYLDAYSGELIDNPTIDHIVPLRYGGEHTLENLCITSFANNQSKSNKPLLVWLAKKARYAG